LGDTLEECEQRAIYDKDRAVPHNMDPYTTLTQDAAGCHLEPRKSNNKIAHSLQQPFENPRTDKCCGFGLPPSLQFRLTKSGSERSEHDVGLRIPAYDNKRTRNQS
jgi:hypothetical protein